MGPGERGHRHFDDSGEESTYSVKHLGDKEKDLQNLPHGFRQAS